MSRKKITVIGAGNVGASVAAYASAQELGDVVLVDILGRSPPGQRTRHVRNHAGPGCRHARGPEPDDYDTTAQQRCHHHYRGDCAQARNEPR